MRASRPPAAATHGHSGACVGAGGATCGGTVPNEDDPTEGSTAGAEA